MDRTMVHTAIHHHFRIFAKVAHRRRQIQKVEEEEELLFLDDFIHKMTPS